MRRGVELALIESRASPVQLRANLAGKLLLEIDDEMLSEDLSMSSKLHRKRFLLAVGGMKG